MQSETINIPAEETMQNLNSAKAKKFGDISFNASF